ncbi:MAG: 2-amino-4-hydroxy-6-hydroxymethyldihydropteridine diphosphokinase [Saprospiraceae bacterium]
MKKKLADLSLLVIHLGSNSGYRNRFLRDAIFQIECRIGKIIDHSAIYETAAWGETDQRAFLNQAIVVETNLPPEDVLTITQQIELASGREWRYHWGPRTLDIDLIFYDQIIQHSDRLTLPHPYMPVRKFVLVPLVDIIPHWVHPQLLLPVSQLLLLCTDESAVVKVI